MELPQARHLFRRLDGLEAAIQQEVVCDFQPPAMKNGEFNNAARPVSGTACDLFPPISFSLHVNFMLV